MSTAPNILIVDDEPRMRDSLSIILRSEGYETKLSSNGEEAIGCLSEREFDLVLLDVIMPGMDGYEVLEHLRRTHPDTMVLMMTGRASAQSAVEAIKKGAYDYLSKPIEHEELLRRIGNAIAQKRLKTEKTKLETQLNEAQKLELMSVLAGGLAHDFNNILTVIQGNVSLMLMEMDPAHLQYQKLRNIEKQVESGAQIAKKLLGYIQREQSHAEIVDINEQIAEIVDVFCGTRKELYIRQDLQQNLPTVKIVKGQLEQILLNLLINAADAMPKGGNIILSTSRVNRKVIKSGPSKQVPRDYVLITVNDTGEGMDEETMNRIFDPFFTTKPPGKGTGLGLTSVYSLVTGIGGYIDVASVKGRGTTFNIYLPAIEGCVLPIDRREVIDLREKETTALLVDDEDVIIEIGREFLNSLGYKVLEASEGESALQIYSKYANDIDIVLLDMMMPGIKGDEVFTELKKINPNVKVVIISGFADKDIIQEMLRKGCCGYIRKPFMLDELSRVLNETLKKKTSVIH